jgi:multidrug efflux pump
VSRFFIDRPIFAWVLAILVMLAGALSIANLPIAQYPSIAAPQISITATYPGASAQTLDDTVTQVIEQKMKGLDRLSYIASTSESDGQATVTLTFENGTNPDTAQVQVQNKLALATPLLPQPVQQQGLQVAKSVKNFLIVVAFISEDGRMSAGDLADYLSSNISDPISRVEGVGDTQMFGSQYSMRIWLNPRKLTEYQLTPLDVQDAVQAQNVQVSAGQIGALPSVPGQELNATILSQTRLRTAGEFESILLRTRPSGAEVRLRDVARIELGSETYDTSARFNGKPATAMAIRLATGANALDTVKRVNARLGELQRFFPPGMKAVVPYDTTPFVRISIEEVAKTLIEAIVLVFGVMYLFLQNFRATLIPTIAVPVVLLGTFGVLAVCGFSINTLTMFATVLAIGLLVDDAIVVVENVERVMQEDGLPPKEATVKSMGQIGSALVGVALVLAAVFVPMAFIGGSSGVIYRQFSVTIVSAMVLSVLVALTLTPALCATLLEPVPPGTQHDRGGLFAAFNRLFDRGNVRYVGIVRHVLRQPRRHVLLYAIIVVLVGAALWKIPGGFLPDEDQGILFSLIQLPPGATRERTQRVVEQVERYFLEDEKQSVSTIFVIEGFSFAGSGQNMAMAFVSLKPWSERRGAAQKDSAIADRSMAHFAALRDAQIFTFSPPPVTELGNAAGFDLMLEDRANLGHAALLQARKDLVAAAMRENGLVAVRANGEDDAPQLRVEVDQAKAGAFGVSIADINQTFATAWGSNYVNDFIDRGRVKKVFLQADAPFRMLPGDIADWHVRNSAGTMVSFDEFARADWASGSPRLERYNGVPSMEILGMAKPGTASSGEAMAIMERLAAKLPAGIGYEWTGLSFQERQAGSQTTILYAVSILVVFLGLAALYESWSIPLAVILVVPLGVLGTVVAAILTWKMNDVYFQVGLLTTIGLAAKNAILIVEFARALQAAGRGLLEATLEAVRLRLRPILMTSLAFMLGVVPLLLASGAGAGSQNAIGTAVFGGMASATLLAILFVPLFFVVVMGLFQTGRAGRRAAAAAVLSGTLGACTLMPHYQRPVLPVPAVYPVPPPATAAAAGTPAAADIGWRDFFADERLRQVIALGIGHNRDLRVAVLDIAQSRAQYHVQRAALLPQIDATAGGDSNRTPGSVAVPGTPAVTRDYSAAIGISAYEIDLFGRLRSLSAEAQESLLATAEARRNVEISLVAEIAGDYLALAADRERLLLAEETLRSQNESYDLTRREAEIGSASDLSLREAETTVESARVDVARYTGQIAEDLNALNLVVGTPVPAALQPRRLDDALRALDPHIDLPAGLPSDLLERRPDVLEAEHTLRAANANIGVARAAFFPSITLTAADGTASAALSGLFARGSNAWTFAPQVTLPLFAGGRNRANLQAARAARDIDVARYEHTVEVAFREVADGLALRDSLGRQLAAQQALTAASGEAYRLSDARFRHGVDSYLNVLDAQRSFYAAQQNLIGTQLSRLANLVTLYEALGGGWFERSRAARAADAEEG